MDLSSMTDKQLAALGREYAAEVTLRRKKRREASHDAKRFKAMQHNNTSGTKGVTFNSNAGKWQAKIGIGAGKVAHLGYFKTVEEAASARAAAEIQYWGGVD